MTQASLRAGVAMVRVAFGGVVALGLLSVATVRAADIQYGYVSIGNSTDLDAYGATYKSALPMGKATTNLVGIAVSSVFGAGCDRKYVTVYSFYDDLTFAAGTTNRLDSQYYNNWTYKLPTGVKASDIIDMAAKGGELYAWYRNGQASHATIPVTKCSVGGVDAVSLPPSTIDFSKSVYSFTTPGSYTPADLVGLAIDDSNSWVFAWYKDGKVSAGTTDQLGSRRAPKPFSVASGKTVTDILAMGIDGENHRVYPFYK